MPGIVEKKQQLKNFINLKPTAPFQIKIEYIDSGIINISFDYNNLMILRILFKILKYFLVCYLKIYINFLKHTYLLTS